MILTLAMLNLARNLTLASLFQYIKSVSFRSLLDVLISKIQPKSSCSCKVLHYNNTKVIFFLYKNNLDMGAGCDINPFVPHKEDYSSGDRKE